jgi:hypothetical protein
MMDDEGKTISVLVAATIEAAFNRFTDDINGWWPGGPARALTPGVRVAFGPDRLVMHTPGGEIRYGTTTTWEPPLRIRLTAGPRHALEIRFTPDGDGTRAEVMLTGPQLLSFEMPIGWDDEFWLERLTAFAATFTPAPPLDPGASAGNPMVDFRDAQVVAAVQQAVQMGVEYDPDAWAARDEARIASAARAAESEARAREADRIEQLELAAMEWPAAPPPDRSEWASVQDFANAPSWPVNWEFLNIALVHALPPAQALNRLTREAATGIMPAETARQWAQAQGDAYWADPENTDLHYGTALEAGVIGEWTLLVEHGGYQALEHATGLSAGTTAVVADWNFGHWQIIWAINGRIKYFLDSGFLNAEPSLVNPHHPGLRQHLDQATDLLTPGAFFTTEAALTLVQRLTGMWLTAPDLTDASEKIALGIHPG